MRLVASHGHTGVGGTVLQDLIGVDGDIPVVETNIGVSRDTLGRELLGVDLDTVAINLHGKVAGADTSVGVNRDVARVNEAICAADELVGVDINVPGADLSLGFNGNTLDRELLGVELNTVAISIHRKATGIGMKVGVNREVLGVDDVVGIDRAVGVDMDVTSGNRKAVDRVHVERNTVLGVVDLVRDIVGLDRKTIQGLSDTIGVDIDIHILRKLGVERKFPPHKRLILGNLGGLVNEVLGFVLNLLEGLVHIGEGSKTTGIHHVVHAALVDRKRERRRDAGKLSVVKGSKGKAGRQIGEVEALDDGEIGPSQLRLRWDIRAQRQGRGRDGRDARCGWGRNARQRWHAVEPSGGWDSVQVDRAGERGTSQRGSDGKDGGLHLG